MKSLWRRPDLVLALVVGEVCVAASIWQAATFLRTGGGATLYPEPSRIVLAYIVFECIRQARPLTGAAVGAYGIALWIVPRSVAELVYSYAFDIVWGTPVVIGAGAVIGLAVATLSWLVGNWLRRKRPTADVVPEPRAASKPAGWVLVLAALLVLAPLAESLGWAFQADFRVALGLWERGTSPWHGWGIFYRLDRTLIVTLASLAAYGMLGRRRWMRTATVTYLSVGLIVTVIRLVFFRTLPSDLFQSGSTTPFGTGYANANLFMLTPAVAVASLVRLNVMGAAVRAIACLVGIPYVLRSRKLTKFLRRPTADS